MREVPWQVKQHLAQNSIDHVLHDHVALAACKPIEEPADVAVQLGYDLGRIAKTLILKKQRTALASAAVVAPMPDRLDFAKVAKVLGYRAEAASAAELEAATSYPRGGVSPLGLPSNIRVVISEALLLFPTILVGAGCVGLEVELAPADLARTTSGEIADISRPG